MVASRTETSDVTLKKLLKAKVELQKLVSKRDAFPQRANKLRQPIRRIKAFICKLERHLNLLNSQGLGTPSGLKAEMKREFALSCADQSTSSNFIHQAA